MAKKKYKWCGIEFDSIDEAMFHQWCMDMDGLGRMLSYERQFTIPLSDKVQYNKVQRLKTKIKIVKRELLDKTTYTADFVVGLYDQPTGLLNQTAVDSCGGVFFIDVKPSRGRQGDSTLFNLKRKWVWQNHVIYVNKVVVVPFFLANGRPEVLPDGCYRLDGDLRATYKELADCPTIKEVHGEG